MEKLINPLNSAVAPAESVLHQFTTEKLIDPLNGAIMPVESVAAAFTVWAAV